MSQSQSFDLGGLAGLCVAALIAIAVVSPGATVPVGIGVVLGLVLIAKYVR